MSYILCERGDFFHIEGKMLNDRISLISLDFLEIKIHDALRDISKEACPRFDGLRRMFYEKFWDHVNQYWRDLPNFGTPGRCQSLPQKGLFI